MTEKFNTARQGRKRGTEMSAKVISVSVNYDWNQNMKVEVIYNTGTYRYFNIRMYSDKLPETAKEWLRNNEPKTLEKIEAEVNPLGMSACMISVRFDVEHLNRDPFEMLKEFERRAKEERFFNKTMIDAVKKYIEENGLEEPRTQFEQMTEEEKQTARKTVREYVDIVRTAYEHNRDSGDNTPSTTVQMLVEAFGIEKATKAVATVVNAVSLHDGRIYDNVRNWAQNVEGAFLHDTCERFGVYGVDSWIHSAHVDQLGQAMRDYKPTEPEQEETLPIYPLSTLGEVLETLDENKTVIVYADGSVNAPEVARYDGTNSIPEGMNSARVHHYAQDLNAYHVYLEEGATLPDMVSTCDISKEIKDSIKDELTDIGCICDWDGTNHISDIFAEWADAETSIYYSDIYKFISEHTEEVERAIDEFGWDGVGGSLMGAGQMGEYMMINNWLWDHELECLKVYALNYIRMTYGEQIERTTWERIEEAIEDNGRCNFETLDQIEIGIDGIMNEEKGVA